MSIHPDKTAARAVDACGGTYSQDEERSGYAQGHRDALNAAIKAVEPIDELMVSLADFVLSDSDRSRADELRDDPDAEDNERFVSWYGGRLLALNDAIQAVLDAVKAGEK